MKKKGIYLYYQKIPIMYTEDGDGDSRPLKIV